MKRCWLLAALFRALLGVAWGVLEASEANLGDHVGRLAAIFGRPGSVWEFLGVSLAPSRSLL
eukprot:6282001-Pyramimonas_sp.AAC.1